MLGGVGYHVPPHILYLCRLQYFCHINFTMKPLCLSLSHLFSQVASTAFQVHHSVETSKAQTHKKKAMHSPSLSLRLLFFVSQPIDLQ